MPPIPPQPSKSPMRRIIACTGDSLTNNPTLGNFEHEFWPALLQQYLTNDRQLTDGPAPQPPVKTNCRVRNLGKNGNTSGPYAAGSAVCNTVNSATNLTFTSVTGTVKNSQTVIVNGQMNFILNWNSGTGVATFPYAFVGLTSGNNYPCTFISDFAADILTRLNSLMGRRTPKILDLLYQFGSPEWDPPDLAVIWIGVNDPGAGIVPHISGLNLNTTIKSTPTQSAPPWPQGTNATTDIPLQTGQGANALIGQAAVIVDWTAPSPSCQIGLVTKITGDTISVSANTHALDYNRSAWIYYFSGGGANPLPSMPPVGASVYQGTQANIMAAVLLLNQFTDCGRFLIGNTQYLNYSASQGDTLATPSAVYATLRPFQAAAVTLLQGKGLNVALADIYGYMRTRIVNGDWFTFRQTAYKAIQGDGAWHFADTNQHLNPLGNAIVAMGMLSAIQSQPGWLDALRA